MPSFLRGLGSDDASAGVAQLVRAPPCHGGGRGFESRLSRHFWQRIQPPTFQSLQSSFVVSAASMLIAFLVGAASIVPASAQAPYPNRPIRIVVPFGGGRLRRYHRPSSGAKTRRTHRCPGGDREPSRRRRDRRRHRRHLVGGGRLHPVRILERHRAVEGAAQVDAVRSRQRVRTDFDHGAVRSAAAGESGLADADAKGRARRRRRRSEELPTSARSIPAAPRTSPANCSAPPPAFR